MESNRTTVGSTASADRDLAARLGLLKGLKDLVVAIAGRAGTLLAFLDEKTRSEACANSVGHPLQLTPIELEQISALSEKDLGIGVPLSHPHFGALAHLIAGPRIASLCEEACRGGSTHVSRELVIAGSIYKLHFRLDGLQAEVFVDPSFPTVSEYELDLTASWLQARLESELMAWGLAYSG